MSDIVTLRDGSRVNKFEVVLTAMALQRLDEATLRDAFLMSHLDLPLRVYGGDREPLRRERILETDGTMREDTRVVIKHLLTSNDPLQPLTTRISPNLSALCMPV